MQLNIEFDSVGYIRAYDYEGHLICAASPNKYIDTKNVLRSKPRKDSCKAFFEKHKVTPTYVRKRINAFMKERVFDAAPNCNKLLFSGSKLGLHGRYEYFEHEDIAEQCKKDGIENVIPFVVRFGKTPQELKQQFGSATWKKICKNSYSKNRFLALVSMRKPVNIEDYIEVPYTLTKFYTVYSHKNLWKHIKSSGVPMKYFNTSWHASLSNHENSRKAKAIVDTFMDTYRMSTRLNQAFNPEWSVRRMQEEHNRLALLQRDFLRKQDPDSTRYDSLQKLPEVKYNDVTAVPLLTKSEIIAEGEIMRHCVGGYSRSCANGRYVVYSLQRGTERSTLGVSRFATEKGVTYALSQHYGKSNSGVDDADFLITAKAVIKQLNEANKQKQ